MQKIQFLCQIFASIHVTVSCCKIIAENYARHNKLRQFNFFLFKNLFDFVRSSKHLEWPNSIVAFIEENVNILLNFMPPDSRHLKRTTKAFVKKSLTVLKETVKEKWKGIWVIPENLRRWTIHIRHQSDVPVLRNWYKTVSKLYQN